ncbi:MAG: pilin [Candidatus Uhrbacteria bacterium]|nr:pilin [Candidatus Uhrbacteria bacterium]
MLNFLKFIVIARSLRRSNLFDRSEIAALRQTPLAMTGVRMLLLFFLFLLSSFFFLHPAHAAGDGTCYYKCEGDANVGFEANACGDDPDCAFLCNQYCLRVNKTCGGVPAPRCEKAGAPKQDEPSKFVAPEGRYGLKDPLGGANVPQIVARMVKYLLGFVGALFLLIFVYGGILWMTAGSSDRVKRARKTLTYAVLGMIVVMLSYTIITIVINLSGSVISGAP